MVCLFYPVDSVIQPLNNWGLVLREERRSVPQCIAVVKRATFYKMAEGPNEFQLEQPPNDGISSVKFSPKSASFLLVSSWDTVSFLVYI